MDKAPLSLWFAIGTVSLVLFFIFAFLFAVLHVNNHYNCVRVEARLVRRIADEAAVPGQGRLPPLAPKLIERLDSYHKPMKVAAEDVEAGCGLPDCIVCQESLNDGSVVMLPCGHYFHRSCIGQWLRRTASCPTCRRPLVIFEAPIEDPTPAPGDAEQSTQTEPPPPDIESGHGLDRHGQDGNSNTPSSEPDDGVASEQTAAAAAAQAAEDEAAVTANFMEQHWQHLAAPASGVHDNRWLLSVRQPLRPVPVQGLAPT